MKIKHLVIGTSCTAILIACSASTAVETFNTLDKKVSDMTLDELIKAEEKGHLSAAYRSSSRHCGGTADSTKCNQLILQVAKLGHPRAMGKIAMRMTSEKLKTYDLRGAYMWTQTKMHFVQPIKLSESEYIRGFQLLEENFGKQSIEYLEGILTDEEIAQAKAEADKLAPELWAKLQEYCKTWKEEDYVCWYEYTDTPNEERIE